MAEQAAEFAGRALTAIAEDRQVGLRGDVDETGAVYVAVDGELRALTFQLAEMVEREPHNVQPVAEYLHGLLEREPMASNPVWEPHRVLIGLFLLGVANSLARVEAITAEEREALRPAYQRAAAAAVTDAFDPTYIAPDDVEHDQHEETVTTSDSEAPHEPTADDLLALL